MTVDRDDTLSAEFVQLFAYFPIAIRLGQWPLIDGNYCSNAIKVLEIRPPQPHPVFCRQRDSAYVDMFAYVAVQLPARSNTNSDH